MIDQRGGVLAKEGDHFAGADARSQIAIGAARERQELLKLCCERLPLSCGASDCNLQPSCQEHDPISLFRRQL